MAEPARQGYAANDERVEPSSFSPIGGLLSNNRAEIRVTALDEYSKVL